MHKTTGRLSIQLFKEAKQINLYTNKELKVKRKETNKGKTCGKARN